MRKSDSTRAYVAHMRSEHRRMHELLREVDRSWSEMRERRQEFAIAELAGELKHLRENLARHFAEEDEGGCLEEAVARCPNLGHDADRLEAEHPLLLDQLDQLIDRLLEADSKELLRTEVHQQYADFVSRLRAHERSENHLLQCGFGIGDADSLH